MAVSAKLYTNARSDDIWRHLIRDGVKTWTPRTDGVDYVMAADINSIYEEVTALETYAIPNNGDASDVTAAFTQASTRANLTSGEKLKISLGKLMKWFADLKTVAFFGKL